LYSLPYADRLPRLLAHRFGLGDVLAVCECEGSLDSAIRNPAVNDVERLRRLTFDQKLARWKHLVEK
jgi:hypothetical protein